MTTPSRCCGRCGLRGQDDDIDAICGPSKDCKNMKGVTFDGYAEPGSDLGSAWRDKLAREGKLRSDGETSATSSSAGRVGRGERD